ncbi:MAG: trypsin-like peptidase domain-containing protein, partial [Flavobacteriales bacterium]|nr:trypsin-like peptidase domain-containing protein [Flavobacteriales bacterium]
MRTIVLFLVLLACNAKSQDIDTKSVVKIYSIKQGYDYFQPWQKLEQSKSSGSGCIIENNRIITNAHVVSNATFIEVRKAGDAKKYSAEVEFIAHDYDLAILIINDSKFFDQAKPIDVGGIPVVRDNVAIYGFPKGGDKLSITEGVVSRIEFNRYVHSGASHMLIQTDASINPGNSGGPVIMDDKLVGIAFQGISYSQSIGYFIPTTLIRHFLNDIEDGRYDGLPKAGFGYQKIENSTMKMFYKMKPEESGIRVSYVAPPDVSMLDYLEKEDIILKIDGENIERDGTYVFRGEERISLNNLIQEKRIGDSIEYEIIRNGERKEINGKLKSVDLGSGRLVGLVEYDSQPEYKIKGGMVFMPLTKNYYYRFGKNRPKILESPIYWSVKN